MSDADRQVWNQRYRDGSYRARTHPTELLASWIDRFPGGVALDVACGRGRNARFLAANGYNVVGVDISEVALLEAQALTPESQSIHYIAADLERGLPLAKGFDTIVLVRFVDFELMRLLPDFLNDGGVVLVEEHCHLESSEPVQGPSDPRFRVHPGALASTFDDLEQLYVFEGTTFDPDGQFVALAQFVGRKKIT